MRGEKAFFKNKTVMITGGTGSIGSEVLKYLIPLKPKKIIIFSRDEYKQHRLKYKYVDHKEVNYFLGDIRDPERVLVASRDVDILFHCAALKHVPVSEEMPEEFVKTNILGSINVAKAAARNDILTVVSVSTDKAVDSSNVMGLTKAIQERIFVSSGIRNGNTKQRFINVRFGNVIGTHGSLFPIFYHQIVNDIPLTVTDPNMTRFFMSSAEAAELIFWAAVHGKDSEIVIKRMKSVSIADVINMFTKVLKKKKRYPINVIGTRVGEKMHERLITEEELYRMQMKKDHFVIIPYSIVDLRENTRTFSYKQSPKIEVFSSDYAGNRMTVRELEPYVRDFTQDISHSLDYI